MAAQLKPTTLTLYAEHVTERKQMTNELNGLRVWQNEALETWNKSTGPFLANAFPSTGKTRFTSRLLKTEIRKNKNVFAVVVVPGDSLKTQWAASCAAADGIELHPNIKSDGGFPKTYSGVCVTYQQLPSIKETIKTWAKSSNIILVLDEVHHCSELATWGTCSEEIGFVCDRVLSLTGTSWRSDGNKIPFAKYDANGICIADYEYNYSQAIIDQVSRRVEFKLIDAKVERKLSNSDEIEINNWSECDDENEVSTWLRLGLNTDFDAVKAIIQKCYLEVQRMREAGDRFAACGLHCLSSGVDDQDNKYVNKIARMVREITNTDPLVIHHGIDGVAEKIARFKDSKNPQDLFIVSIKQLGEGVDCPRLRVGGYLSNITTEMYLTQVVGRYIRYETSKDSDQYAVMVMPRVPIFEKFAASIENKCAIALRQQEENDQRELLEQTDNLDGPRWEVISSTPDGGAHVISGSTIDFDNDYSKRAGLISDLYPNISTATLAQIIKSDHEGNKSLPAIQIKSAAPQHIQASELRTKIKKLVGFIVDKFGKEFNKIHNEANNKCGIPQSPNGNDWLELNTGLAGLEKKLQVLIKMRDGYFAERKASK